MLSLILSIFCCRVSSAKYISENKRSNDQQLSVIIKTILNIINLILIAASIFIAPSANAATIVANAVAAYPILGAYDFTHSFSVPKFDSTLGNLTRAILNVQYGGVWFATCTNNTSSAIPFGTGINQVNVTGHARYDLYGPQSTIIDQRTLGLDGAGGNGSALVTGNHDIHVDTRGYPVTPYFPSFDASVLGGLPVLSGSAGATFPIVIHATFLNDFISTNPGVSVVPTYDTFYHLPVAEADNTVISISYEYTPHPQTINAFPLIGTQTLGSPITISATATSGLPVSLTSTTQTVCTVNGNSVTLVAQGTCTIAADQLGNAAYSAAPTVTQSFLVLPNTSTGNNVVVTPVDTTTGAQVANITFNTINTGGQTTVTSGVSLPALPTLYTSCAPPVGLNISTTATFSGSATVCVNPAQLGSTCPASSRLMHYSGGAWQLLPIPANPPAGQICGVTLSFSPFTIAASSVSVAVGNSHTCALSSSGAVQCWGDNSFGQLGNATTLSSSSPVAVNGLASITSQIAAGYQHTCALDSDGNVRCWGNNGSGQLGDGTVTVNGIATPVRVSGLPPAIVSITAGDSHTCALTNAGAVLCWGDVGTNPVVIPGLSSSVVSISAKGSHTCALSGTGNVWCWGANFSGESGGDNLFNFTPYPAATGAIAISTGSFNSCIIKSGGTIACWGDNSFGQLGVDPFGVQSLMLQSSTPVTIAGLSGVSIVTEGYNHSCVLNSLGGVKCWGDNLWGQLGNNGAAANSLSPLNVTGLTSGVTAISANALQTCAVTSSGAVQCWGDNSFGQLGNTSTPFAATPVIVSGLNLFSVVNAQTITFAAIANQSLGINPFPISATASSDLPVSFSSLTPSCNVSGNTINLVAAGICTITAKQDGNGAYAPAPQVTRSFTVTSPLTSQTQTINFGSLLNQFVTNPPFTVSANASSGLLVIFSSITPTVCNVSGNTVTLVGSGTCTIVANQSGDSSFFTATPVSQSFLVSLAAQTITLSAIDSQTFGNPPFTPTVSASSGLPVTLTSLTSSVCSVSGTNVTLLNLGICTLQASQAGNSAYTAAPIVTQGFSVVAISTGTSTQVPLPIWSLVMLAAGLMGITLQVRRPL
jgi:alpha-tubulin suppressor-like RCC1 family protein